MQNTTEHEIVYQTLIHQPTSHDREKDASKRAERGHELPRPSARSPRGQNHAVIDYAGVGLVLNFDARHFGLPGE